MSKPTPIRNKENTHLIGSIGQGKLNLPTSSPLESKVPKGSVHGKHQDVEIIIDPKRIQRIRQIKKQLEIKNHIIEFITQEIQSNEELKKSILLGKEVGHTISSHIDVSTSEHLISKNYPIKYEVNPKTQDKTTRSFGDIWIEESGHMNRINIKTGILIEDGGSNPNMTSMNRLKNSFLSGSISAYYLAIIKFTVLEDKEIKPVVYFIDALNFVDYLNYNTGTGQIMLKEKELYKILETNPGLTLTREAKIEKLKALYMKGVEEGERKIAKLKDAAGDFDAFPKDSEFHECDESSLICDCKINVKEYSHIPKDNRHFA